MARTINRGAGRGGGRGGNYGRGRGQRPRQGRRPRRPPGRRLDAQGPRVQHALPQPREQRFRDRYRKYYEFICATNEETRQEPGTYLKVLKGIYYHGEEVDSYDAALKVKGVGPMHARKCAAGRSAGARAPTPALYRYKEEVGGTTSARRPEAPLVARRDRGSALYR